MGRLQGIAISLAVAVVPVFVWQATGALAWLPGLYAAEALLIEGGRWLARSPRLPSWSAQEAYLIRLRRWQRDGQRARRAQFRASA